MSAPLPPGINGGALAAPAPAGGGGVPVPLGDVLIRALPERLSGLDRAVSISGTVVAQEDGAATIRTAAGDVTVETPAPLPTDRPVTLRIPPQTPGTPPRAQASAPPAPQAPTSTPATDSTQQAVAPPPTTGATSPPLPSIQPGATIIAMVVAALQPRPPSPPPLSTPSAADGDDVPAGQPAAVDAKTDKGAPAAPGGTTAPARPASSLPTTSPPPTASPPGGGQVTTGFDPLLILPGEPGGADAAPAAPSAGGSASPRLPDRTEAPAKGGTAPSPPKAADQASTDAARLARLARYNIGPDARNSGLLSLQEFGTKQSPVPQVEARLRGGGASSPPTAPSTVPGTNTPSPAPPRTAPAPAPPAGPAAPAGAAPPAAADPDALLLMARLRGGAMPSPPTAAPTVPAPPPSSGPSSPQVVPTDMPMTVARLRGSAAQIEEPTAPPTGPAAPPPANPGQPGKPPPASGILSDPMGQQVRLRDAQPLPPPTAPPITPAPGGPAPQPMAPRPTPQVVPITDMPVMLTRLRDGAPPAAPTAPPTIGTPSVEPKSPPAVPPVPHRQGAMSAALAAQEAAPVTQLARLRDAVPPSPATTPPTVPAQPSPPREHLPSAREPGPIQATPTPKEGARQPAAASPLSPPAPGPTAPTRQEGGAPPQPSTGSPAQASPSAADDAVLLARLRDGKPPAPATAPATMPVQPPSTPRPGAAPAPPQQQPDGGAAQVAMTDEQAPPASARDTTDPPAPRSLTEAIAAKPPPDRPPLPHGQPVRLRVLALEAGPDNAATNAPQTVTGTLVGSTAQGQPVVTTPLGTLVLRAKTDLPAGTTLTLALDIPQGPKAAMLPPLDPAQGLDWPVLREVMATLAATDPVLAKTLAASILPQPNRRLTTNLTFFLSALRGGDAAGWLGGQAAELLETRGGSKLLAQLREDFRAAQQAASEPTADGWRAMPIPFGTAEQLMRAQLHVKNAGEQEKENKEDAEKQGPAKRFLLDLNFSRIGPMQFDGMVRPGRFDLMIRTQNLLPAGVRQQIGTIFRDSLETVGYSGTVAFQTGAHLWARVQSGSRGPGVRA